MPARSPRTEIAIQPKLGDGRDGECRRRGVVGGAIGNLTDRLVRASGFANGTVVDFIHLHLWPTFNVADSCIVIGAGVLVLSGVLAGDAEEPDRSAGAPGPEDASTPGR